MPLEIMKWCYQNGSHQYINEQLVYKSKLVLVRMWRKGNPSALLVGVQTGTATMENNMEVPQKVRNKSTL